MHDPRSTAKSDRIDKWAPGAEHHPMNIQQLQSIPGSRHSPSQAWRKDTSFAALSKQQSTISNALIATIAAAAAENDDEVNNKDENDKNSNFGQNSKNRKTVGNHQETADQQEDDFGLKDMDEFLNQRSELFRYYKHKDYTVEPF